MKWTILLHVILVISECRVGASEFRGNSYSVEEVNQEFTATGDGDAPSYAPWMEDGVSYAYSDDGYSEPHRSYMLHPGNDHSAVYVAPHAIRYSQPSTDDMAHLYQESIPSIHSYRPSFAGKDFNEYPHVLPPGGKSIEQLQREADYRLKKIFFDSRENQKLIGEKIKKLKDTYGHFTIGYPGYKNTIRYEPIDLGSHNAIDLGTTLDGPDGKLRLPLQTVTVTKTLGVKIPQPYPVRHDVPVPAPFPVPFATTDDPVHNGREVKQYLDAFASEFAEKATFAKPESIVGKITKADKEGVKGAAAAATAPASHRTYGAFHPSHGLHPPPGRAPASGAPYGPQQHFHSTSFVRGQSQ